MILGKLEETHLGKLKCSWGFLDWVSEGLRILRSWTNIESNQKKLCTQKPQKEKTVLLLLLSTEYRLKDYDESKTEGWDRV